jgi:predicted O-methyltransferase YrrM
MITPECVGKAYRDGIKRLPATSKILNVESAVSDDYIAKHLVEDASSNGERPARFWSNDETPPGDSPQRRTGASISWADCQSLQTLVRRVVERHPERPIRIVEVGSWCGESALAMESMFGPAGGMIYCVDTWEGSSNDATSDVKRLYCEAMGEDAIFKKFLHNTGHKKDRIRPLRGASVSVAKNFSGIVDLIFLDAAHGYQDVKADIEAWLPYLADDGIICGHDFGNLFPGVVYAVDEAFQKVEVAGLIWAHDRALKPEQQNGHLETLEVAEVP